MLLCMSLLLALTSVSALTSSDNDMIAIDVITEVMLQQMVEALESHSDASASIGEENQPLDASLQPGFIHR